jgi:drug/metabolite transporter (DMT)-like permease
VPTATDPRRAALLILASTLVFAAMGALIKIVAAELPNTMVVFVRNLLGLAALAPWIVRRGPRALATDCFAMHLTRSLAGLTGMYCFFYAIGHLPLAEAMLFNYAAPLFIPFIAAAWLGEALPAPVAVASFTGFAGIALILKPGMIALSPESLVALASGMFTAVAFVSIRRLALREPAWRIVFYFASIATVVSAVPLAWSWTTPAPHLWGMLVTIGILATGGQLLVTRAYGLAPAGRLGPYSYMTVVFSAGLGWAVWGDVPDLATAAGAVLVCVSGAIAARAAPAPTPLPSQPAAIPAPRPGDLPLA